MKSWYEISNQEAINLEKEFKNTPQGKKACQAMHICITIGLLVTIITTIIFSNYLINNLSSINPYLFTILILFLITGITIIYLSTIEYQQKYNSYLEIKHKLIRK